MIYSIIEDLIRLAIYRLYFTGSYVLTSPTLGGAVQFADPTEKQKKIMVSLS